MAAALTAAGFTESPYPFDLFGREGRPLVHLGFAVGIGSSTPQTLDRQSARGGFPRLAVTTTELRVRWAYALAADALVADFDAALTAEVSLVAAVVQAEGLSIRWVRTDTRTVHPDGTHALGLSTFAVLHAMPLAV